MAQDIGFVGLGMMGEPMAANLLRGGFSVRVYNRTASKAAGLQGQGASVAQRAADVARPGGVVFTMVANDAALEEVVTSADGFGEALGEGGLHDSMSTISPETAKRLSAWHADRGSSYVAAPVFGRPAAAATAKLWIVTSGPGEAKARARPMFDAMGQGVFDFGDGPGTANVVKLSGNFLIATVIESLGEALTLAEKHGVDRRALADFYTRSIFATPVYQSYAPLVAAGSASEVGFHLKLGLKDVKLILETAERGGVPMPIASILRDRLVSAMAKGRGELDWSMLTLGISEDAGLKQQPG